jgi:hypothetical protein
MINSHTDSRFTTPVLFIIFNRPHTTKQVFEAIRKARPTRLYIAADGPRVGRPDDAVKCAESKRIATLIDWPCEVKTLFRDRNLGCGEGPSTAISWFFEHETEGIILEDDCLPSQSFFTYCAQMLEHYRNDTRIMEIGGNNLERPEERDKDYSYSFSNHIYIWGWATWRRAWNLHSYRMKHYEEISRKKYLDDFYDTPVEHNFFSYIFEKMHRGDQQTNRHTIWDYQWQFACTIHSGLILVPNGNLVRNLGFGNDATNTLNPNGVGYDLPAEEMQFPLRHPEFVMVDKERDYKIFRRLNSTAASRIKANVKRFLPKSIMQKVFKPILALFAVQSGYAMAKK